MAWGTAEPGADALISKARGGAPSLIVLPFRRFGDDECVELCAALADNVTLLELKCSGHALGAAGAEAVGRVLGSPSCAIRRLALGDSTFGGRGVSALLDGLGGAECRLLALDLGLKGLVAEDASHLAALLCLCPDLHELELGRNELMGVAAHDALAPAAPAAPPPLRALCSLDLSETGLSDGALAALVEGIEERGALPALTTLRLSRNPELGAPAAASTLGRAVSAAHRLRTLALASCALRPVSARALGAALARCSPPPSLAELDLSANPAMLADPAAEPEAEAAAEDAAEGRGGGAAAAAEAATAAALAEGLGAAPHLASLNLGQCGLGDAAASVLGARLAGVAEIEARSNRLGCAGAVALLSVRRRTLWRGGLSGPSGSARWCLGPRRALLLRAGARAPLMIPHL